MLVILHPGGAALCGPSGDEPPVYPTINAGQVERLCREALEQPDRHAALRYLSQALPSLETALPGVNNEGLVALHELQHGAPRRQDWGDAGRKAKKALGMRDGDLLGALGFQVEKLDNLTSLLRSGDRRTALAVMLRESESPEAGTARFNSLSPVSYALTKADAESLPWVILVQGNRLRLYSTAVDAGVGRRGRTETYVECQPSLLSDEHLPYLWLLYSAEALTPSGSLSQILGDSQRFAGDLAERLRERIYDHVVPELAKGIAVARNIRRPSAEDLSHTYEMALTVLFRLLFIAYAEDRDLLPYRYNEAYRRRSLKQKAQELADCVSRGIAIAEGDAHWKEMALLWQAVASGNREWGVPAYDGGLFTNDLAVSKIGAELEQLCLPNTTFEDALRNLLVIETPEGVPGPVDFRSLGVREFGTIYEGLLESELAVAEVDLVLKKQKDNLVYIPADGNEEVTVSAGETYLHNRSGTRKSSGSYYTKHIAVEHLLDHSLEPALEDHFSRLGELDDLQATEAFFDFRVADIAMGSGHFLIAAIDRIEKRMADFLASRDLPGVRKELSALRNAALKELDELAEIQQIEDGQLLRRMIARRCIYGVDLNPLSVQLARLAVWIHTFVPGLPLSLLDHTLVQGNALVGVGTVEDIRKKFEQATGTLFAVDANSLLGQAAKPLNRLARLNDATLQDIASAREAMREARAAIGVTAALCDLITAGPLSTDRRIVEFPFEDWERLASDLETISAVDLARQELANLQVLHFPVAFPEVFLRRRPGFDVILGNPPWDKLRFEPQQFWVLRSPGLNALPADARTNAIEELRQTRPVDAALERKEEEIRRRLQRMVNNVYQLQGRGRHGHHDSAKLFTERAIILRSKTGRIGYVLPRTALVLGGWADLREAILTNSHTTLLQARNRNGWLFDDVHGQIMVVLLTTVRRYANSLLPRIEIWPAIESARQLELVSPTNALQMQEAEVESLTDTWVVPWFSSLDDKDVFQAMRERHALGSEGGWIKGIADSSRWDFSGSGPHQKYTRGKDSGARWDVLMARHVEQYRIASELPFTRSIPDPRKLASLNLGVVLRGGSAYLKEDHPAIVYRYPTMANNTRTLIAAILPETGYLYSKGYVHGLRALGGTRSSVLALLGYLNSFLADWWCRRFVDRHITKSVLDNLPLPDWSEDTQKEVSDLVSVLVARGGLTILANGEELKSKQNLESLPHEKLLAAIECHVLRGFGLGAPHWESVVSDFTDTACSEGFRKEVRKAVLQCKSSVGAGS